MYRNSIDLRPVFPERGIATCYSTFWKVLLASCVPENREADHRDVNHSTNISGFWTARE